MISCDTNVLFAAVNPTSAGHDVALGLFESFAARRDFLVCEQVLLETYCLLRNPAAHAKPLTAPEAAEIIGTIRSNPAWAIVDVPARGTMMNDVWEAAAKPGLAFRRVYDLRMAHTLLAWGVDTFYTRNLKDFRDVGFARVVDPFA